MSWGLLERVALFVPIVFLIMVVYSAPGQVDARGVVTVATRKSIKVVAWVAVIVIVMQLLEWIFL